MILYSVVNLPYLHLYQVKLGSTVHKTEVYKKSLNPQWNSEWFRFELDDEDLQDEPLQIRLVRLYSEFLCQGCEVDDKNI